MAQVESEALRAARRSLEGIPGIEGIGVWQHHPARLQWSLEVRIRHNHEPDIVPALTAWHLVVDETYPFGQLAVFPDKRANLPSSFPHQRSSIAANVDVPWGGGNVCANTQFQHFGRTIFTEEPWQTEARLRWYAGRLVAWIEAAATATLIHPDDPFERPVFDSQGTGPTFAFHETEESYADWQRLSETAGIVEFIQTSATGPTLLARRFLSRTGRQLMPSPWPARVEQSESHRLKGVWIRLPELPLIELYQTPRTWAELATVASRQRRDLWPQLKYIAEQLRGQDPFILLVGYPIKDRNKGDWSQLQWQAAVTPALCTGPQRYQDTKLKQALGRWLHDRQTVLADSVDMNWRSSKNWAPQAIQARGRFSNTMQKTNTLIIGAGALGSLVAEQLARGGLTSLTIIDHDLLEIGNLVRHTLSLEDLYRPKATALAERLNLISPHITASAFDQRFTPDQQDAYQKFDLIIDTTGSDEIFHALAAMQWDTPINTVSVSVGLKAHRLFFYAQRETTFDAEQVLDLIEPLLAAEREQLEVDDLPREEMGCWNPVFPARSDDMWLMVSAGVKELADWLTNPEERQRFVTFTQQLEGDQFVGIMRNQH